MAENQNLALHKHHQTHWHYIRRRRIRRKAHTAREIFYGQLISLMGATASGLVLEANKTKIAALVGAYLILPGVFDLSGSAAGAMGARLNHIYGENRQNNGVVFKVLRQTLMLVSASAIFLAIFSAIVAGIFFGADLLKIFYVTAGSVILSSFVGMPIVAFSTVLTKKKGLDPDNFIGPIESSIFDVLSIIFVTLMVVVVK